MGQRDDAGQHGDARWRGGGEAVTYTSVMGTCAQSIAGSCGWKSIEPA